MDQERALMDASKLRESLSDVPDPLATPFLIIMSGLPGTGKSYLSRKIADRLPCVVLTSDTLRKVIFPVPAYDPDENQRLFTAVPILVEDLLSRNIPVLLDATNLVEYHREQLYHIADKLRLKLIIIQTEAPAEVVRERLNARITDGDLLGSSDADVEVHERMKASKQKIRRNHFVVDTSKDITPVVKKVIREVQR